MGEAAILERRLHPLWLTATPQGPRFGCTQGSVSCGQLFVHLHCAEGGGAVCGWGMCV